ncbi:MAG TPA: anti-sigma factor [Bryobacteraceae bacterium]|nr:anti-sigma factor [Bryobacteraceae bacterium]
MSCETFEKLIALDAGGDLTPPEAARLQAHLGTCAPCRELARSVGESQSALKALAQAGVDEDALARWRRSLLARIDDEPRRRILPWRWAWAAAAAMALVALLAVPRMVRRPPSEAPVAHALPPASPNLNALPHPPQSVAQALPPASPSLNRLPHPPQSVAHALPPASQSPSVAHRRPRPRRAPAPSTEPLLVKLETPDPNVVIYWIVEGKGN